MSYKWINHEGTRLYDLGVNKDGSLHNPNGYPDDVVRAAVAHAKEEEHQWRSDAAKQAAETRRRRQEKRVYQTARRIASGEVCGPRSHCCICKRGLGDPESVRRGIGSECWQDVLAAIEAA